MKTILGPSSLWGFFCRHTVKQVVNDQLQSLLAELEQFGSSNDSATAERSRKMLNSTRDTGEFLAVLIRAALARRVLDIGTSNGYSTLWLADGARAIGGSVTRQPGSGVPTHLHERVYDLSSAEGQSRDPL